MYAIHLYYVIYFFTYHKGLVKKQSAKASLYQNVLLKLTDYSAKKRLMFNLFLFTKPKYLIFMRNVGWRKQPAENQTI